jgi:hypothetical protein
MNDDLSTVSLRTDKRGGGENDITRRKICAVGNKENRNKDIFVKPFLCYEFRMICNNIDC